MKKYTFIVLLIVVSANMFAQTVLNQFPIELKKSSDYFQILNGENEQKEYFTIITDKQKCTVLKYNSALFFKDSLSISRPDKTYDFMAGMTFSNNGNPQVYWASKDYQDIKLIDFDLKNHTTTYLDYENDFKREKIIDAFVAENVFQILSVTAENQLRFTHFSNSGKNQQVIDLESKDVENSKSIDDKLVASIFDFGLTKIDPELFTPLYVATAKVKRYLKGTTYVLSFDIKNQTSLIVINLNDYSFSKEVFPYEKIENNSGSNSFLHQDVLYQLTANSKDLSLTAIDLKTKKTLETYRANAKEEITFKNSPLLIQSENGTARELKKTSKLLSKLNTESLGLSIYSTPNYNLFTIGGVREVASGGSLALTIGLGIGAVITGSDMVMASDIISDNLQSIYFESFFDSNFKHTTVPFRPLYIDGLGAFTASNHPAVYNIYKYNGYVILNYYDSKNKEFVMRKFENTVD